MSMIETLPEVRFIGDGVPMLVPGSYASDEPLPIVGGMLQTRTGPVRVAGQIMTAEGPVMLPARAGEVNDGANGSLKVVEHDRDQLGPLAGPPKWREDQYRL